jgi:hypothetical protein
LVFIFHRGRLRRKMRELVDAGELRKNKPMILVPETVIIARQIAWLHCLALSLPGFKTFEPCKKGRQLFSGRRTQACQFVWHEGCDERMRPVGLMAF